MSNLIDWLKPNGSKITTNALDETVEYAESLGWKRTEEDFGEEGTLEYCEKVEYYEKLEYYEKVIAQMKKNDIEPYVKELCGFDVDLRLKKHKVQETALVAIKEHLDNA